MILKTNQNHFVNNRLSIGSSIESENYLHYASTLITTFPAWKEFFQSLCKPWRTGQVRTYLPSPKQKERLLRIRFFEVKLADFSSGCGRFCPEKSLIWMAAFLCGAVSN